MSTYHTVNTVAVVAAVVDAHCVVDASRDVVGNAGVALNLLQALLLHGITSRVRPRRPVRDLSVNEAIPYIEVT